VAGANATTHLTLKQIQKLLQSKESILRIEFKSLTKKEKDTLARTVKLTEEVGELANEILSSLALQRKSKLDRFDIKNLYEEFADIILATIALANTMHVDIDRAVDSKMKKVIEVYSKDR
jgi:NTP pyrophosphatase (non-canonical NTP hydrolase)